MMTRKMRVTLEPGQSAEVKITVRNFRSRDQRHRIEVCTPPGVTAQPSILDGVVSSESRQSFPVRLFAGQAAKAGVRIAAFDITLDGKAYGQWFDFIIHVADSPAESAVGKATGRAVASGHREVMSGPYSP